MLIARNSMQKLTKYKTNILHIGQDISMQVLSPTFPSMSKSLPVGIGFQQVDHEDGQEVEGTHKKT